jgi:hypothetical protein
VLVKGAWKDCEVTGGDGTFFYLFITLDQCSVTVHTVPAQWVIDEPCHNQVDITFCGMTITIISWPPTDQFAAWVIKHVVMEQSAPEKWCIKDETRCWWVAEELRACRPSVLIILQLYTFDSDFQQQL